jgi:HAD superfamily hydrolase (TIGR01549 family)
VHPVLRAVLFDLDGTLLDIEVDRFLRDYFAVLGPAIADATQDRVSAPQGLQAVMRSTEAMCADATERTNRDVFEGHFRELTGADLSAQPAAKRIEEFYRDEFPRLRRAHGPRPGAISAVEAARDSGLRIALATNPIFPLAAIRERMRWAELDESWFEVITSYESMHACKPDGRYFEHVARMLGVPPTDCLMVGDDAQLDLPAEITGMRTFYVGPDAGGILTASGDLVDVRRELESLA